MKLKDLFKKKATPKPIVHEELWKPEPVKRIIPTVIAKDKDGNIQEIPYGTILNNLCLIAPDGEYYHPYVGCYATCPEWQLVTIKEAINRGYSHCPICFDKIEEAGKLWIDDQEDGDDI